MHIPLYEPVLDKKETELVLSALADKAISGYYGQYIGRFEEGFARYCGCSSGVAVNSGTTALHVALASLGIGPGDEVLVSSFTNMATFFAVASDFMKKDKRTVLDSIRKAGHEVANHSLLHRRFQALGDSEKKRDVAESTRILEDCLQGPVCGFRAPGWGCDKTVLKTLEGLGYQYDASLYPSPWGIPLRWYYSLKTGQNSYLGGSFAENLGFQPKTSLALIPLTTAATLPFYGSVNIYSGLGMKLFNLQYSLGKKYQEISYILHARDLVDTEKVYSGARMGMLGLPYAEKIRRVKYILKELSTGRECLTMKSWVEKQSRPVSG